MSNGDRFEGLWMNDEINNVGIYLFLNRDYYTG
jgi:hypothetical protein